MQITKKREETEVREFAQIDGIICDAVTLDKNSNHDTAQPVNFVTQ